MKIISCGDSYTLGEGLSSPEETYGYLLAKEYKSEYCSSETDDKYGLMGSVIFFYICQKWIFGTQLSC